MKQIHIYLMLLLISAVCGCDSGNEPVAQSDYFPLQKGIYQIYDVEETVYELGTPQTVTYELRTLIVDSIANNDGYKYVMYRYKRSQSNEDWQYLDTWAVQKRGGEVIVWQENVPFVDLVVPIRVGDKWNGNQYNNVVNPSTGTREDQYTLEDQGTGDLGKYVDVLKEDNQEFIVFFDRRFDRYADHIGLVRREITQLEYCTQENCLGQQKVERGIIYKQEIKSYGKE